MVPERGVAKCGGMANRDGLPLILPCKLGISLPSRFLPDSLWSSGRGVVGSDSGPTKDSSSTASSGLPCSCRCALIKEVLGICPYSASVLPYSRVLSMPRSCSPEYINDGRCGVTSRKPAARVQLLAKFSMLFTPPTCAREFSRRPIEDLEVNVSIFYQKNVGETCLRLRRSPC